MRAFVVSKYKGPLHEADVPEPVVGEHDVLVQVQAAGLNVLDEKIRSGAFKSSGPTRTASGPSRSASPSPRPIWRSSRRRSPSSRRPRCH